MPPHSPSFPPPPSPLPRRPNAQVPAGDEGAGVGLNEIFFRFGASQRSLMLLNADMTAANRSWWSNLLPPGTGLCLIPDTCATDV